MLLSKSIQMPVCSYVTKNIYELLLAAIIEFTSQTPITSQIIILIPAIIDTFVREQSLSLLELRG